MLLTYTNPTKKRRKSAKKSMKKKSTRRATRRRTVAKKAAPAAVRSAPVRRRRRSSARAVTRRRSPSRRRSSASNRTDLKTGLFTAAAAVAGATGAGMILKSFGSNLPGRSNPIGSILYAAGIPVALGLVAQKAKVNKAVSNGLILGGMISGVNGLLRLSAVGSVASGNLPASGTSAYLSGYAPNRGPAATPRPPSLPSGVSMRVGQNPEGAINAVSRLDTGLRGTQAFRPAWRR
jgi:hypothetical protein